MSIFPNTYGRCDLYPESDISTRYTYTCGTDIPPVESVLTIPAVNLTEDEHGSRWECTYNFGNIGTTITLSVLGMLWIRTTVIFSFHSGYLKLRINYLGIN